MEIIVKIISVNFENNLKIYNKIYLYIYLHYSKKSIHNMNSDIKHIIS